MPRRDGTGPMGAGPATGRGFGPCTGYSGMGTGVGFGRGFDRGFGMGIGRGLRRCASYGAYPVYGPAYGAYAAPYAPDETERRAALEGQVKALETQLEYLKNLLEKKED